MGWSHRSEAGRTLQVIEKLCRSQTDSQNTYIDLDGSKRFFEVSCRTQDDGSIKAKIYKFVDNDRCIKVGSLKIEGNGAIVRGPKLFKDALKNAINEAKLQQKNFWEISGNFS